LLMVMIADQMIHTLTNRNQRNIARLESWGASSGDAMHTPSIAFSEKKGWQTR
jgi:hypothetical protein